MTRWALSPMVADGVCAPPVMSMAVGFPLGEFGSITVLILICLSCAQRGIVARLPRKALQKYFQKRRGAVVKSSAPSLNVSGVYGWLAGYERRQNPSAANVSGRHWPPTFPRVPSGAQYNFLTVGCQAPSPTYCTCLSFQPNTADTLRVYFNCVADCLDGFETRVRVIVNGFDKRWQRPSRDASGSLAERVKARQTGRLFVHLTSTCGQPHESRERYWKNQES